MRFTTKKLLSDTSDGRIAHLSPKAIKIPLNILIVAVDIVEFVEPAKFVDIAELVDIAEFVDIAELADIAEFVVVIDIVVDVDIVELNLPSPATAAEFEGERFWNDNPAGGSMVSDIVEILGLHVFKLIPLASSGWNFIEISDITSREIRPAMASSGKGTNAPTAAEDDKFEQLLAAPGCS